MVSTDTDREDVANPADASRRPPKQARLLAKACESCKAKKSRCDSSRPQCSGCRRKGIACIYGERGQPGLRPGYGKAVEYRLSLLEDNMEKMTRSIQDVLQHIQTSSGTNRDSIHGPATDVANATTLDAIDDVTILPSSIISQPLEPGQVLPGSSSPEVARLPWNPPIEPTAQETTNLGPDPVPVPVDSGTSFMALLPDIAPPPVLDSSLPPESVVRELVHLVFQNIYPWAPLFHQETFRENLYAPERLLLLHGIVVLGFRFWRAPEPPASVRAEHIKASRAHVLLRVVDDASSLVAVQALALLAIDAVGEGPGPRAWNLMAMLVASVSPLHLDRCRSSSTGSQPGGHINSSSNNGTNGTNGINLASRDNNDAGSVSRASLVDNEDPDSEAALSSTEAEERHRLFWTIYSLDRFSSAALGQPSAISCKTIRLPYPVRDDCWGRSSSIPEVEWFQRMPPMSRMFATAASFAPAASPAPAANLWQHYIDILSLGDQANHLLVHPVNLSLPAACQEWQSKFRRLDVMLMTWFESLPPAIRSPPAALDPVWMMVHATYYLTNIRLFTVAAFPSFPSTSTPPPHLRPSPSARIRCRQAVSSVAYLVSSLSSPEQVTRLGPLFAFVVWVAARSLVILWTTGYETSCGSAPLAMPRELETLLGALRQAAVCWPCAQNYVEIIELILATKNNPAGATGLDIFNDTRRTAYGLQSRLGGLARYGLGRSRFGAVGDASSFLDGIFSEFSAWPLTQPLDLAPILSEFHEDWIGA